MRLLARVFPEHICVDTNNSNVAVHLTSATHGANTCSREEIFRIRVIETVRNGIEHLIVRQHTHVVPKHYTNVQLINSEYRFSDLYDSVSFNVGSGNYLILEFNNEQPTQSYNYFLLQNHDHCKICLYT